MADNIVVGANTIATDDITGVHWERVKLTLGADGVNDGDVSVSNPVPTREVVAAGVTLTNVAAAFASTVLLASSASRRGAHFYNDSTEVLYLKFGAAASPTSFTKKLNAGEFWSLPLPLYTGAIEGIWDAVAGTVRITEMT